MNGTDTHEAMERVVAFVNTHDAEAQTDALASPDVFAAWLQEQGLLTEGESVRAADVDAAVRLRKALRAALLAHDEPEPAAKDDAALPT